MTQAMSPEDAVSSLAGYFKDGMWRSPLHIFISSMWTPVSTGIYSRKGAVLLHAVVQHIAEQLSADDLLVKRDGFKVDPALVKLQRIWWKLAYVCGLTPDDALFLVIHKHRALNLNSKHGDPVAMLLKASAKAMRTALRDFQDKPFYMLNMLKCRDKQNVEMSMNWTKNVNSKEVALMTFAGFNLQSLAAPWLPCITDSLEPVVKRFNGDESIRKYYELVTPGEWKALAGRLAGLSEEQIIRTGATREDIVRMTNSPNEDPFKVAAKKALLKSIHDLMKEWLDTHEKIAKDAAAKIEKIHSQERRKKSSIYKKMSRELDSMVAKLNDVES